MQNDVDGFAGDDQSGEQRTPISVVVFCIVSLAILAGEGWLFWKFFGWLFWKLV